MGSLLAGAVRAGTSSESAVSVSFWTEATLQGCWIVDADNLKWSHKNW